MWRHIVRTSAAALFLGWLAGAANATETDHTVAAFDRISVSVAGNIRIHQDSVHRVRVVADDANQQRIQVEVDDGHLKVYCRGRCTSLHHDGIDIYLPSLRELNLHNGGHMQVASGFSAIEQLQVSLRNGGRIDALALAANEVTAQLYNGGHISLAACQRLTAKIRNGGQIRYAGNPKVDGDVINGGNIDKAPGETIGGACPLAASTTPAEPAKAAANN